MTSTENSAYGMSTIENIYTWTVNGTTYYESFEQLMVAKVIKAAGNYGACLFGPKAQFEYSEQATREAAHNVALKHALGYHATREAARKVAQRGTRAMRLA